jgi:acyl-homoserine lactone acylase PvdQ
MRGRFGVDEGLIKNDVCIRRSLRALVQWNRRMSADEFSATHFSLFLIRNECSLRV